MLLSKRGHIKLVDFGLAAVVESSAGAAAQSKVGTATYFSPEKNDGVDGYDSKADMWAAGCVLLELGTGERLLKPLHSDRPEVREQREARIAKVGRTTGSALLEKVARGLLHLDAKQRLSGEDMFALLKTPSPSPTVIGTAPVPSTADLTPPRHPFGTTLDPAPIRSVLTPSALDPQL